jgi:hypothetical protein
MLRATAAITLAWALTSSAPAWAGQDPVPPGTVMIGPIHITPTLRVSDMGVDNNVFNEAVDPKTDFTFTLTPRADVLLRMRRLQFKLLTTTDYVYYRKYHSERGTNTSSSARVEADLGRLSPYASVQGVNSKSRVNNEIDVRARHRDLTYGVGVAFKIASRTSVLVNGSKTTVQYDDDAPDFRGVELEESLNGRRSTVDAGLSVALTPITSLTISLARDHQRFTFSPERDADSWRVAPTLSFSPTGVLRGTASVGYRRFNPISPAVPDYVGIISAVSIGATIYGRHEMQAVFNRDVQYSYDVANTYYVGTGGTVTWTWLLIGPLDLQGTAGRHLMDYRQGDGDDVATTYGFGAGYRFSERGRVGVNIHWQRRDSNTSAEREFRNHRIFAGLSWGTTQ